MSTDLVANAPGPRESPEAIEAYKRAMPMQRLLGSGMDYANVVELYRRIDTGESWAHVGEQLGDRNIERAVSAAARSHLATARDWYLAAAACYRVAQNPLPDGDSRKTALYHQLIDAFAAAGALTDPPTEHVEIPWKTGRLMGWLLRPASTTRPPTVIVMGGFDGWREEYHTGATYLIERGLAVLLVDGPGQGETRLFEGLTLGADFPDAYSAMVSWIHADQRLADHLGIWGNSLGGYLAAAAALHDDRIGACCVNGGSATPVEFPRRYRQAVERVQLLLGIDDAEAAVTSLAQLSLSDKQLTRLRCPLLVLHGTPDPVFDVSNARALFDGAAATDKTWSEWPDGDHCIYNHSLEKHTLVADWFADRLLDIPAEL